MRLNCVCIPQGVLNLLLGHALMRRALPLPSDSKAALYCEMASVQERRSAYELALHRW